MLNSYAPRVFNRAISAALSSLDLENLVASMYLFTLPAPCYQVFLNPIGDANERPSHVNPCSHILLHTFLLIYIFILVSSLLKLILFPRYSKHMHFIFFVLTSCFDLLFSIFHLPLYSLLFIHLHIFILVSSLLLTVFPRYSKVYMHWLFCLTSCFDLLFSILHLLSHSLSLTLHWYSLSLSLSLYL